MIKKYFCLIFVILFSAAVKADPVSLLQAEFHQAYGLVSSLKPDAKVGDYLNETLFNDYSVLWRIESEDDIVITFYKNTTERSDDFRVTYYKSKNIVPGKVVIRRLVGNILNGLWVNHTIDVNSSTYIGSQGHNELFLAKDELELLREWNIEIF